METTIPRASVCAKPLTVPEPMKPSTAAAISVVIFPSRIAESAFWKPIFIEDFTVLPVAISSRIRAKIITLASTAIPIDRIIPAIPGSVRVISKPLSSRIISTTYMHSARELATPGIQ